MKVLMVIPPKVDHKWIVREDKYNGEMRSCCTPYTPIMLYTIIKRDLPFIELQLIEAQRDNFDYQSVVDEINLINPDIIITYISWCHIDHDRKIAELPYPTIAIIVQQTIDRKEAADLYDLKSRYICKNEIEIPVVNALKEFNEKKEILATAGFLVRQENIYVDTGDAPLADMEDFPIPDFEAFQYGKYFELRKVSPEIGDGVQYLANLNTMKGCLFNCAYCGQAKKNWEKIRFQTADQVFKQIKILVEQYGVKHIVFIDNEFGVNRKRAKNICKQIIESGLNFTWQVNNRIELFDDELIGLLAKAGCTNIRLGIETCDPKLQDYINKKLDLNLAKTNIKKIKNAGITVHLYFICGIPGETKNSLKKNAKFIATVEADTISNAPLFLMPNSMLYNTFKTEGCILTYDWTEYKKPEKLVFLNDTYPDFDKIIEAKRYMSKLAYKYIFLKHLKKGHLNTSSFLKYVNNTFLGMIIKKILPDYFIQNLKRDYP